MRDYSHEPSYESHYEHQDHREPYHDSYDEGYGGDAYSEEPTYTYEPVQSRQMYKQPHVYKRSATDEMGAREGQFFIKKLIFPAPEKTTVKPDTPTTGTPTTVAPGPAIDDDEKFQPEGRTVRKRSVGRRKSSPTSPGTSERSTSLNREVFPGCFSSPPEDCGAHCVASFREDEGCYQCCCMDKTVNATTCALPVDGGRCRGNFKRWAFNERRGKCEPFTYSGCDGNGNRFMCKEMCERHCVEEGGRDGQASTCPLKIRVSTGFGWNRAIGVASQWPGIYQTYIKENREVGSGEHWVTDTTSPTGPTRPTHAIWKDGSNWLIGTIANLGTSLSVARIKSSKCPHNVGFDWKYFETATDSWVEAGRGLVVREE